MSGGSVPFRRIAWPESARPELQLHSFRRPRRGHTSVSSSARTGILDRELHDRIPFLPIKSNSAPPVPATPLRRSVRRKSTSSRPGIPRTSSSKRRPHDPSARSRCRRAADRDDRSPGPAPAAERRQTPGNISQRASVWLRSNRQRGEKMYQSQLVVARHGHGFDPDQLIRIVQMQ